MKVNLRLGAVVSAIALCATLLPFRVSADWPQWRGPNRDGYVVDAFIPATWPKTLKEEWRVPVGSGHSSPVALGNRIYVFTRESDAETLRSLDAATGKEIWKSSLPVSYEMHPAAVGHGKGPKSTPLVSNGNIYTLGIAGVLSCHEAATGKLKWRHEYSKEFPKTSPLYGTAMSPVIDNGLVIAHVGGHDKGALTAFDPQTGAVKWTNDLDGPAYASPMIVTLAGIRQVVTFMQKQFVGVDAANGKLLWQIPSKTAYDENIVTAVPYKDMVIFSRENQGLTAIRLSKQGDTLTPQEVWRNPDNQLYLNSPVLQGNQLIGFSVKQKGQFFGVDADTGKTIWQSPGRSGDSAAILNLSGKALMFLTNDAKLIIQGANSRAYSPVAEYTVASSPTWAHPLVLGKRILIKDENSLISYAIVN